MEQEGKWKVTGIGEISYTQDRAIDGKQSLRFRTSVRDTAYLGLPGNQSAWKSQTFAISGQAGVSSVQLRFDKPQDWSAFNRISYWIYVHPTSMPRHNINLEIKNEGTVENALSSARSHYSNDLKPGKWNHVLFEMPHLPRDKVTMFSLTRELTGNNPGEDPIVTYDIDRIELQRVDTDQYEGWTVAPGKFSFSHVGYRPADPKTAMVGSGASDQFQLVDPQDKVVYSAKSGPLKTRTGHSTRSISPISGRREFIASGAVHSNRTRSPSTRTSGCTLRSRRSTFTSASVVGLTCRESTRRVTWTGRDSVGT